MSDFGRRLLNLLGPAVTAARLALSDMDDKEIPANMRRVASYSGGNLPPPLAKSVLSALDGDEWLREKALEKLDPDDLSVAARAFLERDDAWWSLIAVELARASTADAVSSTARTDAEIDDLEAKLAVAKKRLKRVGSDLDAERARARRLASQRTQRNRRRNLGDAPSRDTERKLEMAIAERVESEAMVARLRTRLKSLLREQRRAASEGDPDTGLGGDPVARARHLDLLAAAAPHRFDRPADDGEAGSSADQSLRLPAGVRPDSADAVDWLIGEQRPVTLLVDGYNVLYGLDPATFTTSAARRRLAERLGRLKRALGRSVVAVVYDSDLPGERERHVAEGGIEVHFSDADELADDAIVAMTETATGDVVVVTSDRDLRERVESVGGLTLWSEALTGWLEAS